VFTDNSFPGLTMNSLTSCSEKPVCWDPACSLCYDPLEQYHAPCPALLSVQSCSALPPACTPVMCWPKVQNTCTVAKCTVHDWGDIVDSGIGLLYRPARIQRMVGSYDNPMQESTTYMTQSGTMNLGTSFKSFYPKQLNVLYSMLNMEQGWVRSSSYLCI
jgi:hypothetical protein